MSLKILSSTDATTTVNADSFLVRLPIPEQNLDSVVVECSDGFLTITGENKEQNALFERHLHLPEGAEAARLEAFVQDGTLHIHAPRLGSTSSLRKTDLPEPASVYYRLNCGS